MIDSTATHGAGFAITERWDDGRMRPLDVGQVTGPRGYDGAIGIDAMPYLFRMYDDDGVEMARGIANEGSLWDEELNPLTCYGMPALGCTELRAKVDGEWRTLIG